MKRRLVRTDSDDAVPVVAPDGSLPFLMYLRDSIRGPVVHPAELDG